MPNSVDFDPLRKKGVPALFYFLIAKIKLLAELFGDFPVQRIRIHNIEEPEALAQLAGLSESLSAETVGSEAFGPLQRAVVIATQMGLQPGDRGRLTPGYTVPIKKSFDLKIESLSLSKNNPYFLKKYEANKDLYIGFDVLFVCQRKISGRHKTLASELIC